MRFHIAMSDVDMVEIEQASEHLIGEYFKLESRDFALVAIFLQRLIQIAWKVVHHNVQILFLSFVSEETVSNL